MIVPQDFERRIADALAAVAGRVGEMLVERVPPDVRVVAVAGGVALIGAALARRSLTDARLRDIAGLLR